MRDAAEEAAVSTGAEEVSTEAEEVSTVEAEVSTVAAVVFVVAAVGASMAGAASTEVAVPTGAASTEAAVFAVVPRVITEWEAVPITGSVPDAA